VEHFGVQARALQALAKTGRKKGFFFYIGIWVLYHLIGRYYVRMIGQITISSGQFARKSST
jgi:hypothetical protein